MRLDLDDHSPAVKDAKSGVVLRTAQRPVSQIDPAAVSERQNVDHVRRLERPAVEHIQRRASCLDPLKAGSGTYP